MTTAWTAGRATRALLTGVAVVAMAAGARPSEATSLEQSVETALVTNPEVGVVAADREAVDQELRQARSQYFPSLDLRGAAGPEYTNSPATRARLSRPPGGEASTTLLRLESQVTLSQMLFDGFATRSEVERQLARVDSASRRVAEAAEFIGLDAIEAHLNVLRNQALVDLAAENVEEHRRILEQVSQLEREGGGTVADVTQAEARLSAADSALATAIGNLRDARATYIAVVGSAPEDLEAPEVPVVAVPESAEAAAVRAAVSSPPVQIAESDIEIAKAELRGARSGFYPRLDLELGASANDNLDGIEGSNVDAQALVVARYNLFRGGADIAREREAFARLREARESLRGARRSAEEEARITYNALTTARARMEALRAQAEATRSTRDAYAQQFDLGQRSLLDLLDSENELFLARAAFITAQFTEIFAVYRVLAVIGDLLQILGVDAPPESINIYRERRQTIHEVPIAGGNAGNR